ncbi:EscU/YscU/HrcU family type III secretion system export apparatus switch protein [Jonesia quinghaiensis]|uniref:EscU/YscU/HrcU family type III secretion system export apparatus switch protein n=1 Tax=Jonesia quinghaiensis TaxID=262806 RepID=UPI00042327F1|nr:EscU/YscU/HrcU family type III secretion system export apparatus switch protein [Jonesia quinghaiensis]
MSEDKSQEKTEDATPKRMKEVRRDGSLQKSQDLSAWAGIGAGTAVLPLVFGNVEGHIEDLLMNVRVIADNPDPLLVVPMLGESLAGVLPALAPMLAITVVAAIAANTVGGITIATKKLKPTFKQFNLIKGVKQKFGMQAVWQGVKALLKTIVIGTVLYLLVQGMIPIIQQSGALSMRAVLGFASDKFMQLMWTAVAAGVVLAVLDVVVVRKRNRKKTKMTRKEVKDENKNTEGDPLLKGAIRSRQLAMSRNRMISSVADADVVVVNPTHVAVALTYVPGEGAPKLVAKGKNLVAQRIRDAAEENGVPLVRDIPLARALNSHCEIGHPVPGALFTAVAQVLAFVMLLKQRGAAMGAVRAMPAPTDVPEDMYDPRSYDDEDE